MTAADAADIISPCPGCKSDQGAHIRIIKRPKKKKSFPSYKTVKIPRSWPEMYDADVDIAEEKIPIQRRHNPDKYLSLMGLPPERNPIINPPRTIEVTDGMRKLAQNYANWWKVYNIPFELARLYFQKHPDARDEMKEYFDEYVLPVRRILGKVMESVFDYRWNRSLRDWSDILITAIEKSPRKAREEHYGLTPDGERIHLSINRIKQMKPWLWEQVKGLPKQTPFYITFIDFIFQAAKKDPELYEELKRLDQDYDYTIRDGGQHYYTYFECRHPNKELYEKQKLKRQQRKRKSNPDGWKTCCTLKPSGLAKMPLKHKNFWLYKSLLNGMDTLDEDGQRRIVVNICNLLIDMGWPKRVVLEKLFADKFESILRRKYREDEVKGLKHDYSKFDVELDENLHKVFRSNGFRQIKLKPN
jgi:hypothetical protein